MAEYVDYELLREARRTTRLLEILVFQFCKPTQIQSSFEGGNMPQLTVGQTVVETITESNAEGNVPVIGSDITFASSDETVATVVNNGDGTATWTAIAPGTITDTFSDIKFNLSGTDTITVVAAVPVPTEIASTFGAPTP